MPILSNIPMDAIRSNDMHVLDLYPASSRPMWLSVVGQLFPHLLLVGFPATKISTRELFEDGANVTPYFTLCGMHQLSPKKLV
jgi:hypothetical protein